MSDIVERLRFAADDTDAVDNASVAYLLEEAAAKIERVRLAPDEREAINAMACYFDTKGSIQMQAWGSLLRVILLRNDRIGSGESHGEHARSTAANKGNGDYERR